MVEDLFLSKERMSDNFKELEAQREVLISILLRLIPYQEVVLYFFLAEPLKYILEFVLIYRSSHCSA